MTELPVIGDHRGDDRDDDAHQKRPPEEHTKEG